MNTLIASSTRCHAALRWCCIAVAALASAGCQPVTIKMVELTAVDFATGSSGFAGSTGFCFSAGNIPPSGFSAGPGEIMVGFDDFFRAGTNPFPCDDVRAAVFRGGVLFDLSQFDNVTLATLVLDTSRSAQRSGGTNIGSTTPKSFATMLGVATQPFTSKMNCDNDVTLTAGTNINVGVGGQVKDWVDKTRPNFGFVIWGPRDHPDSDDPPRDNDAQISWYRNVRLRISYNPALNPRAPQ